MNIIFERRRLFLDSEAEFKRQEEERQLRSEIMSHVHFLEDHGDAVERSGFAEIACILLDEANGGARTQDLLLQLYALRKEIEEEVSRVREIEH